MNCEGTEMRCPCNKPKPNTNTTVQTTRADHRTTDVMKTVSAIKRVIVRCPCNRPTGKVTQNSPKLPRQQLAPSRKEGNRILPEGHGQPRRKKRVKDNEALTLDNDALVQDAEALVQDEEALSANNEALVADNEALIEDDAVSAADEATSVETEIAA